jgi:hypothetical protein
VETTLISVPGMNIGINMCNDTAEEKDDRLVEYYYIFLYQSSHNSVERIYCICIVFCGGMLENVKNYIFTDFIDFKIKNINTYRENNANLLTIR